MKTYAEDKQYLLNIYNKYPIVIKKAKGMFVYSKNKKYLDLFSALGVNILGHRNKKVLRAVKSQLKKHLHVSNYFVTKSSIKLARLLVNNSFASKVLYTNSGTEANEAALKLVRLYGGANNKNEVITLQDSFHGRTYGGMSLTGQRLKNNKYAPLLDNIIYIKRNNIEELREKINPQTVAIFIEIIQGEGGVHPLKEEYIEEIIRLREEYKFLIVVDEVQTGLLRTGLLFAYMHHCFNPDIMTLAKALGGGFPLGAVLVSEKLTSLMNVGDHGSTFGGNPVACSAGLVVLREASSFRMYRHVNLMSDYLFSNLLRLKENYPAIIKDVRGQGLMIGIEIAKDIEKIKEELFESNILINITNNNIIRLLPALIIKKKHIDKFIKALVRILDKIEVENVG